MKGALSFQMVFGGGQLPLSLSLCAYTYIFTESVIVVQFKIWFNMVGFELSTFIYLYNICITCRHLNAKEKTLKLYKVYNKKNHNKYVLFQKY